MLRSVADVLMSHRIALAKFVTQKKDPSSAWEGETTGVTPQLLGATE
jgi:hypothetical protein